MKIHAIATLLFCCMTAALSNECYGQTIHHTVTRGETIETIAELYDTTTDKLSSINNDIDTFYTGLPILIPYPEDFNTEEYTKNPERILEYYSDYKRLKKMYSNPYTKDAEEAYKKLIEEYGKVSNCSGAYYELAKYYYNKDKLNKARVTFYMALSDDALSPNKKKEGNAYIEKIENILAKREEKRKRIWGNIGTGIVQGLQAGAYAYMQYEQTKQSSGGNGNTNSSINKYSASSDEKNMLAMQQIANYTINQTTAAWNGTPMMPTDMSAVNLGSDMTPGSPAWTWNKQQEINIMSTQNAKAESELVNYYRQQAQQIEKQIIENPTQPIAGYTDRDGNWISREMIEADNYMPDNNDKTIKESNNYTSYYKERYGNKICHICNGYKKCIYCNGTKIRHNDLTGKDEPCNMCWLQNGARTGLCRQCGGSGQTYGIKN